MSSRSCSLATHRLDHACFTRRARTGVRYPGEGNPLLGLAERAGLVSELCCLATEFTLPARRPPARSVRAHSRKFYDRREAFNRDLQRRDGHARRDASRHPVRPHVTSAQSPPTKPRAPRREQRVMLSNSAKGGSCSGETATLGVMRLDTPCDPTSLQPKSPHRTPSPRARTLPNNMYECEGGDLQRRDGHARRDASRHPCDPTSLQPKSPHRTPSTKARTARNVIEQCEGGDLNPHESYLASTSS
jgi:hypothetical protein